MIIFSPPPPLNRYCARVFLIALNTYDILIVFF